MLLPIHIVIALCSLIFGSIAVVRPSRRQLSANFIFIAATLTSGTLLVVHTHSPILQSCISGLTYVCIMTVLSAVSYRRLAGRIASTD